MKALRIAAGIAVALLIGWGYWMWRNVQNERELKIERALAAAEDSVSKYKTLAQHYEFKAKLSERKYRVSDSLYRGAITAIQRDSFRTDFRARIRTSPAR